MVERTNISNVKLSIITPTLNLIRGRRKDTFLQCLESIKCQEFTDYEHLVIDGGSTDGTIQLLKKLQSVYRFRLVIQQDHGIWDALDKAIPLVNGRFVNVMNTDDYFFSKSALTIASNHLDSNKDWFFSDSWVQRLDGTMYLYPTSPAGVFACGGIVHQSMWVSKEALELIRPFKMHHITNENYLMMVLLINKFSFKFHKKPLTVYREGGYSLNAYTGKNYEKTKNDFGEYFYELVGKTWSMSQMECASLIGWNCFSQEGIVYSWKLSSKIQIGYVRRYMRLKLLKYLVATKGIRGVFKITLRVLKRLRLKLYLK